MSLNISATLGRTFRPRLQTETAPPKAQEKLNLFSSSVIFDMLILTSVDATFCGPSPKGYKALKRKPSIIWLQVFGPCANELEHNLLAKRFSMVS